MSASIFRIRNFNPNNLTYSDVNTNSYGGKVVYINTTDRKQVHLQTPKMRGGVQKYQPLDKKTNQPNGPAKYTLRLSFGFEPSGMIAKYREVLKNWDDKMIDMAQQNCVNWFRKKAGSLSEDAAQDMYTPMLNISIDPDTLEEDGKYPDSTRFKLAVNEDGSFDSNLTVYDEDQNEITNVNDIPAGCQVIAIVKCNSVWFAAGKYGISWRVVQMQVFRPQRVTGFSILPDLDPEDETQVESTGNDDDGEFSPEITPDDEPNSENEQGGNADQNVEDAQEQVEEPEETEEQVQETTEETKEEEPEEPEKKKKGRSKKTTTKKNTKKSKSLLEDF